jgi:type VI secretion system protein ImpE
MSVDEIPELPEANELEEVLARLKQAVREKPEDAGLRLRLFELFSVEGEWERAGSQLETAARIDRAHQPAASWFRMALASEPLRRDIFTGRRTPLVFGEPEEWMGWMVGALQAGARGDTQGAQSLRRRALETAAEIPARINDEEVSWVIDADPRLGPILEVIIGGAYYWMPMTRVERVQVMPSGKLSDRVWVSAYFRWVNQGELYGLIPTRYACSERSEDAAVRLATVTDWVEGEGNAIVGLGHRQFGSDHGDFPLLSTKTICWTHPSPEHSEAEDGEESGLEDDNVVES